MIYKAFPLKNKFCSKIIFLFHKKVRVINRNQQQKNIFPQSANWAFCAKKL